VGKRTAGESDPNTWLRITNVEHASQTFFNPYFPLISKDKRKKNSVITKNQRRTRYQQKWCNHTQFQKSQKPGSKEYSENPNVITIITNP
jgi:hypothetical protein